MPSPSSLSSSKDQVKNRKSVNNKSITNANDQLLSKKNRSASPSLLSTSNQNSNTSSSAFNNNSNNNVNNKNKNKKANNNNNNNKAQDCANIFEKRSPQMRSKQSITSAHIKEEMSKYVIWKRPLKTIYYFILELADLLMQLIVDILKYRKIVLSLLLAIVLIVVGFNVEGNHLSTLLYARKKILWCLYWIGLGVASSIGLGTGLHTFLLYLGPFIAEVTLAAYECNSLNFPEPPYPDEIICPNVSSVTASVLGAGVNNTQGADEALSISVSILSIMSKVRLESFMWGAGTAIGELPPYFMARASALSSLDSHKPASGGLSELEQDEEFAEFEHLLKAEQENTKEINLVDRMRLSVFKIIRRVGFWGILLCASIPNPLFDLAGITCGHFLVRFTTFFGATLIGKAIIKMHLQKMFVIFLFSKHHLDNVFDLLSNVPFIGEKMQPLFQEWLNAEKAKLHQSLTNGGTGKPHHAGTESILSWILNKIVLVMVLFFVISIVNSLAQRRFKRLNSHLPSANNKLAND
jgi:vacuole membrane protein 1